MPTPIARISLALVSILFALSTFSIAAAQSCPHEPEGGGEGISGSVSINGSSQPPMIDGAFLPVGTHAVANAGGQCKIKGWCHRIRY